MRKEVMRHDHQHPCLHCHPQSYIRMVQHLIERCLLLRMTQEDCVKALTRHAGIRPLITLTVWKELMRENRGFFHAYFQGMPPRPSSYHQDIQSWTYGHLQGASRFRRRQVMEVSRRQLW